MRLHSITVLAALMMALPVSAQHITGKWQGTAPGPRGDMQVTFDFEVEGEELTGKTEISSMNQEIKIKNGKIEGNQIAFKHEVDFRGRKLIFAYKGSIHGDSINLTRTIDGIRGGRAGRSGSPRGSVEFTVKRIP